MGEIKSTLELAMERTKKFALSDKEKEEMKPKGGLAEASSLFHRYPRWHLSLNEVRKEVEKMEGKKATMVKQSLLSQWIDALSLNDDDEKTLKGIESLKQQGIDEIKENSTICFLNFKEEKEKVKEKMRANWLRP